MLRGTRPSPMAKSNGRSSRVACPDDDRAPRRHVMADRRSEKEVLTLSHAMTVQYGWSCLVASNDASRLYAVVVIFDILPVVEKINGVNDPSSTSLIHCPYYFLCLSFSWFL